MAFGVTSGSFPILLSDDLAQFVESLKMKPKELALELYSFFTRKGVKGYGFNFDGTATAEVTGGFMPPPPWVLPAAAETWSKLRATDDFRAIAELVHRDFLPLYILTFTDSKLLEDIKSYKMLRGSNGYFKHHFKDENFHPGIKIDVFRKLCLAGEKLVEDVLHASGIFPTKILAWLPK